MISLAVGIALSAVVGVSFAFATYLLVQRRRSDRPVAAPSGEPLRFYVEFVEPGGDASHTAAQPLGRGSVFVPVTLALLMGSGTTGFALWAFARLWRRFG